MRNAKELINAIKKMPEEYAYIKSLIADRENLFFAIRNEYLSVYYLGGCLAKIELDKNGTLGFCVHEKYVGEKNNTKKNNYVILSCHEHKERLEDIKENIKKIALNEQNENATSETEMRGKTTREKICQQWIINQNNNNSNEWFYIDMEYVMEANPLGRFDMIAVKRTLENGMHQVALVELKVGSNSYTSVTSKLDEMYQNEYKDIKENSLYEYQTQDTYVSFGSGLVGHLCDYMRYLHTGAYKTLQEEIVCNIEALVVLGILDANDELASIKDASKLSVKPDVYFVSFSHVVDIPNATIFTSEQMRLSFYKYMYKAPTEEIKKQYGSRKAACSKYAAENMLNVKEIEGLSKIKEDFLKMQSPAFSLKIGTDTYDFRCIFVDAERENSWSFL